MNAEDAIAGIAVYDSDTISEIRERIPDISYLDDPRNRKILRAAYKLYDANKEVTPVTVDEYIRENNDRDLSVRIANLVDDFSFVDRDALDGCLDIVMKDHVKKETRRELERAEQNMMDGENPFKTIQKLTTELEGLQSELVTNEISPIGNSAETLYDMLNEARDTGKLPGTLSTGFSVLDDRIKGIARNDLIIISADTGLGKTSLALQMADTITAGQNKNALIFSGEMHGWEVLLKLLSKRGVATLDEMQDGELTDRQWQELTEEEAKLQKQGLYTIRESQPTIHDFRAACRKADKNFGIDIAVLDYVQMLKNPNPSEMNDVEHLNMASSELRDLTNSADIPVLAISRENKSGEVYGSSQLKYDCNYRIVIQDPGFKDEPDARLFSIKKARLAKGGDIKMKFEGENSRFVRPNHY